MDLDPVPEIFDGENLLGLNHIEFVVADAAGDNLCQTRLIVDVHP